MKIISKIGLNILKIVLGIITAILTIIVIINILMILSTKVLKEDYPTFLDFTYFIPEDNDSSINIKQSDFLLIDLKKEIEEGSIVVYKNEKTFKVGQVIKKDDNSIIKNKSSEETIAKEQIIGKVSYKTPQLGNIIRAILKPVALITSVIALIIISILSSIVKKRTSKEGKSKPNFNQTW